MIKWGLWLAIISTIMILQGCKGWTADPWDGFTYDSELQKTEEAVQSCHQRGDVGHDCQQWEKRLAKMKGDI